MTVSSDVLETHAYETIFFDDADSEHEKRLVNPHPTVRLSITNSSFFIA